MSMLRMKSIFGPPNVQQTQTPQPIQPQPVFPRIDENIEAQVEEPEMMQNQSLNRFLESAAPERGVMNKKGKVANFLMAIGGMSPEARDQNIFQDYYGKMADHQANTGNLLKGAQIEATQMNNQGLADYRNRQAEVAGLRANTGARNTDSLIQDRAADNARQGAELELRRIIAGTPSARVIASPGQPIRVIDGKTGKQIAEYPAGTLSKEREIDLLQQGRMELASANNDAAMGRTVVTQTGANQRDATGNPLSPTQNTAEVDNRVANLLRVDPKLGKWVTKNPDTGHWEVAPVEGPGWTGFGGNGLTEEIRQQLVDFINTGKTPNSQPTGVPMTGGNNPVNASPIGGNPDTGLTGVNTGFPKPGGIQLNRPPGDPNNPMGFQQPQQQGQVMRKTQTNVKTGQKRTVISTDGGVNWRPE